MKQYSYNLHETVQLKSTWNSTVTIYMKQYSCNIHETVQLQSTWNSTVAIYMKQYSYNLHETVQLQSTWNSTVKIYMEQYSCNFVWFYLFVNFTVHWFVASSLLVLANYLAHIEGGQRNSRVTRLFCKPPA